MPAAPTKIKPAGWVLIVLALGVAGYWSYTKVAPFLEAREERERVAETPQPAQPAKSAEPAKPAEPRKPAVVSTPAPPKAPDAPVRPVLSKSLFPPAPMAPPPEPGPPAIAIPPLVALKTPVPSFFQQTGSEREAIHRVVSGAAQGAVVSAAAFAGSPQAIRSGIQVVWYLGTSRADAAITACDAAQLRKSPLNIVSMSLAHYQLLALLAGEELPPIHEYDDETALAAHAKPGQGGQTLLANRTDQSCGALPESAFGLVLVQRNDHPIAPAQLNMITSALKSPPTRDAVVAFFHGTEKEPSPFDIVFESAGKVWASTHHIDAPATSAEAFSLALLEPPKVEPPKVEPPKVEKIEPPKVEPPKLVEPPPTVAYGYPSWLDR